jgi:hypothetical protein
MSIQQRYDIAYAECMHTRGDHAPGMGPRGYPPPPGYGPPPPPPPGY